MNFDELLEQVLALVQRQGRVSYRAIKRRFDMDDDYLADLREEILFTHPHIREEEGRGLVWTAVPAPTGGPVPPPPLPDVASPPGESSSVVLHPSDAERRQLTVLFCDLVDSTPLCPASLTLKTCARWCGPIKTPAPRSSPALRGISPSISAMACSSTSASPWRTRTMRSGPCGPASGCSTLWGNSIRAWGRSKGCTWPCAWGSTPGWWWWATWGAGRTRNSSPWARPRTWRPACKGWRRPNTLVISAATFHLLGGFFACQPFGTPLLKGFAQPLAVYRVLYESMARSRLEAAGSTGLTPLVGREQEIGLLVERWAQVKEGLGQVVLLSGEAGIGKSRLVQVLKDQMASRAPGVADAVPVFALLPAHRLVSHHRAAGAGGARFEREESPPQKLRKLEGFLVQYGLPLAEAVPLFATLLSLPLPAGYAPLTVSPE